MTDKTDQCDWCREFTTTVASITNLTGGADRVCNRCLNIAFKTYRNKIKNLEDRINKRATQPTRGDYYND